MGTHGSEYAILDGRERCGRMVFNESLQPLHAELLIRAVEYLRQPIGQNHQEIAEITRDARGRELPIAEHRKRHLRSRQLRDR